jgi:4-amino-4-deoxy-L-arabinose transferase-like glycosyltransferase
MADDKTGLLSGSRPSPPSTQASTSADAVYHDSSQSPKARLFQVLFVVLVIVMVLVAISLSIYQGIDAPVEGAKYLMLGISLAGFVAVEILMIVFTRRGDLPRGKTWFLYFVGVCVILEATFVDILLFD